MNLCILAPRCLSHASQPTLYFFFSSHSYIGVIVDMRKKKKKRFILESYAISCVDLLSKYKYERFVKVTLAFSASHLSYFT